MAYFEELLQDFKEGAKLKLSDWEQGLLRARINQAYIDLLGCAERSFEFQKLQIKLAKLGDSKALLTPNPYAEDLFSDFIQTVEELSAG